MKTAISELDRVVRKALRAALPVYRTTPTELLYHGAGIPLGRGPRRCDRRGGHPLRMTKATAAGPAAAWLRERRGGLLLFTDGSKLSNGNTGAGWALYRGGVLIGAGSRPYGPYTEVYNAELYALRDGLTAAHKWTYSAGVANLWACSDSQSGVRRVLNPLSSSLTSQGTVKAITTLIRSWPARPFMPQDTGGAAALR